MIKELKTGAVRIAADAGVPLIPMVLWGTQRIMTKDHKRDFSRGRPIAVRVGTPLHPTGADPVAETAELKAAMEALLDASHPRLPRPASPAPGGSPGRTAAARPRSRRRASSRSRSAGSGSSAARPTGVGDKAIRG